VSKFTIASTFLRPLGVPIYCIPAVRLFIVSSIFVLSKSKTIFHSFDSVLNCHRLKSGKNSCDKFIDTRILEWDWKSMHGSINEITAYVGSSISDKERNHSLIEFYSLASIAGSDFSKIFPLWIIFSLSICQSSLSLIGASWYPEILNSKLMSLSMFTKDSIV